MVGAVQPDKEEKQAGGDRRMNNEQKADDVCPNCGYCKHCGRGGHHVAPWVIPSYPYPWIQPVWIGGPWTLSDQPSPTQVVTTTTYDETTWYRTSE